MNDQVENLSKELDISIDIAKAVNKSLNDVTVDPTFRTNTPIQSQHHINGEQNRNTDTDTGATSYQLWNHHYVEVPAASNNQNITEILEDWNFIDDNVRNKRRTSMEDIFKVRHFLNPRSSFCNGGTNDRCWVTLIHDEEDMPCVIALNSSLRAHHSKMILCVIIPEDWDLQLPQMPFLTFVRLPKVNFAGNQLTLLTLWKHLDFEFCCYISPFAILQRNIDEILLNEEIYQEIDNETCVFLTNESYQRKRDIVFLLFKPNLEVGTAMEEFLRVYSGDSDKLKQLQEADVYDALNTLFGEAWGIVGRELCQTLHQAARTSNAAVLNFENLKPWNGNKSGICELWWNIYKNTH